MASHRDVLNELQALIRPDKAEFLPKFFQAFPGGYGEGDKFLGVVVPDQRRIAKRYRTLQLAEIEKLLKSHWHECRLTGLVILTEQFQRADEDESKAIVDFYLCHLDRVNNWDLVDASAHKILGERIFHYPRERKILNKLSRSSNMWHQRVSIIATLPMIKNGEFDDVLWLSQKYLNHSHDLMHKAVGWMLREMGKKDVQVLAAFLSEHVNVMPRTMLRYAIEKLPEKERRAWLNS